MHILVVGGAGYIGSHMVLRLGPGDAAFTETHPYEPNSPYSASNAPNGDQWWEHTELSSPGSTFQETLHVPSH